MNWEGVEVKRVIGEQSDEPIFVREVNRITAASFGADVPIEETYDHLEEANLGHFVYMSKDGFPRLIAYALNETFEIDWFNGVNERTATVNYFSSAFILPEIRKQFSLYKMLGSMRLTHDEDIIMTRTQNPIVMSFFAWLCEFQGMRLLSPHRGTRPGHHLPNAISVAIKYKFELENQFRWNMIFPDAYGRCLTGQPIEAKTPFSEDITQQLDVLAGDAALLVGRK
ncbi:hypothetical protein HQ571_06245 [Candidatus Kuenenbacteria bacterium]|nr:hypothetical protein [Candidatus Kuenenbacteria bacterium]